MSKLKDLVMGLPLCNTVENIDFMSSIDKTFSNFPENFRKIVEEDLVKVFEKGLILGLHHFNNDGSENEYED